MNRFLLLATLLLTGCDDYALRCDHIKRTEVVLVGMYNHYNMQPDDRFGRTALYHCENAAKVRFCVREKVAKP
jgi:hypothetical protein